MSFKLPRTDIRFLDSVKYFSTYFLVFPNYNFKSDRIENSLFYKCFSFVYSLIYISLSVLWMFVGYEGETYLWLPRFILWIIDVSSIWMFSVVLYTIFVKGKRWEKFMKAFRLFDVMLHNKNVESSCVSGFFLLFLIGHLVVTLFYVLSVCHITYFQEQSLMNIIPAISYLHFFSISTLLADLVYAIKIRYQLIYEHLSNIEQKEDTLTFLKRIEKGKTLYELNGSIVNLFNKIFGWHILIIQCKTIATILRNLDYIVQGRDVFSSGRIPYLLIFVSLILVYGTTLLILRCHSVKAEAENIQHFCCLQYFSVKRDSEECKVLESLLEEVKDQPKITAAGFFEIDRSLLLSTLNILTTYFIVLIQVHTE